MSARKYDILAIDLDGTLFDPTGQVSDENVAAVGRAQDAGIHVVLATGRGLPELENAVSRIQIEGPLVISGGAMTIEYPSGRTLRRAPMQRDLAERITHYILDHGHNALLLKDRWTAGYDYLVIGEAELDPASEWWFENAPLVVKRVPHFDDDEHGEETVRIGIVTSQSDMKAVAEQLLREFADETLIHHFPALSGDAGERQPEPRQIELLELFSLEASKWHALAEIAADLNVERHRVAAIGDEINDLPMITHAGLGIAMGNAVDPIIEIADRVTRTNAEHGVAHAIDQILTGAW